MVWYGIWYGVDGIAVLLLLLLLGGSNVGEQPTICKSINPSPSNFPATKKEQALDFFFHISFFQRIRAHTHAQVCRRIFGEFIKPAPYT